MPLPVCLRSQFNKIINLEEKIAVDDMLAGGMLARADRLTVRVRAPSFEV